MKITIKLIVLIFSVTLFYQCDTDDTNSQFVPPPNPGVSNANDQYLYDNNGNSLFERYDTAARWRWNDNFIAPDQRAAPIQSDLVIPATKLIDYLWIEPFTLNSSAGKDFIDELFPPELVYIGSYIYNRDGSILLGFAEGGARVTLLNLNSLDFKNRDWLANPGGGILTTVHHEFSHIVHQNYGIPVGFNVISESYIGGQWINISRDEAIKLGMVRGYATSNEFEDFCEIISHFLVVEQATFEKDFIDQEDCSTLTDAAEIVNCRELNGGRQLIKQKLDLVIDYYKSSFDIDLLAVRDTLQERLGNLIQTGVIPE